MDGNFVLDWVDDFDEAIYWIETAENMRWLDGIIALCKAEIERRKGILDELTQDAQELKIGY